MKSISYLLLIIGLLSASFAHAKQAGEIKYARGAVTVQKADGSGARLVGKGEKLYENEVIKTGPRSFAIINLTDKTRMTLRPQTSFSVEEINAENTSKASALLRLFKGGFRVITGFISKRNPRGYRVKTPAVTIGIRGTEFIARLCNDDCAKENKRLEKKLKKKQARVVGRVVYQRGKIKALNFAEKTRGIKTSSDLYEGDTLTTGNSSYAVIVFRDKSRITLQANSDFRIDELRFDVDEPSAASALFSLLRGGLRAVTGLVGKLKPKGYRMRTRFSTIGIRGTGYDLLCTGLCAYGDPSNLDLPKGDGLYASVWKGTISLDKKVLDVGQFAFVRNVSAPPVLLSRMPAFFRDNPVPKPDEVEVEDIDFSQTNPHMEILPGFYVGVTSGEISIKSLHANRKLVVKKDTAGFADVTGRHLKLLPAIPAFLKFDIYPAPDKFEDDAVIFGNSGLGDEDGLVCEVR